METHLLKLTYIPGLKQVVLQELETNPIIKIIEATDAFMYIQAPAIDGLMSLRSVINVFLINKSETLTPKFISSHKSILGKLIEKIVGSDPLFKTFKLSCAGSNSKEVQSIKKFIAKTYKLVEADEADLEVYIGKVGTSWECGVRITPRPLSLRTYKKENIKGALNPTIAYAMNTFCNLDIIHSYLNIFSGSATLLIEAGISNPKLQLIGFDNDGKRNAAAIQNIKAAGLIKSISLKTADIFDNPDLGTVDCITSDLPFGMQINETDDLPSLYKAFLEYCEQTLHKNGKLVVYTAQHQLFENTLQSSLFKIDKIVDLTIPTSVSTRIYLHPKIFVCYLK